MTVKGCAMVSHAGRHPTPSPTRNARGGTIINIITAVVFFGLIALGIMWIMKTAGEAGQQYTTAMVGTRDKAAAVSWLMAIIKRRSADLKCLSPCKPTSKAPRS